MRKALVLLPTLSTVAFADNCEGLGCVGAALSNLCTELMSILPVVSMFMVIAAGVVYSSGQMMGAETRARANTWATAMLIGAIIGILIVTVTPPILNQLGSGNLDCGYTIN